MKTSLFRLAKPITYLGAYRDTIDLSEEKKNHLLDTSKSNTAPKQMALLILVFILDFVKDLVTYKEEIKIYKSIICRCEVLEL